MKALVASDERNALSGVFTESDGPPLEHDEWVEEQSREHERQRKEQERQRSARANPNRRQQSQQQEDGDDEIVPGTTYRLADLEGKSDEELLSMEGIGEGRLKEIKNLQKQRANRQRRR